MSNILRRPMFRKGGKVDSRGTGITSGLDTPRQNYEKGGEVMKRYGEILGEIQAQRPKMSLGDWLRIAATGARIAGAPGRGGGIADAFTAAAEPLAELGGALAQSQDVREASESKLAGTLLGAELEQQLAREKVSNLQKDYSYNRQVFESKKQYSEPGLRTIQADAPRGYAYADAESLEYQIPTVPYIKDSTGKKTEYLADRTSINVGEVYFDPLQESYVVFKYDENNKPIPAITLSVGDANRKRAQEFAKTVSKEKKKPVIKKEGSQVPKKTSNTAYEDPFADAYYS